MRLINKNFDLKADIKAIVEHSFPAARPDFTTISKNARGLQNTTMSYIPREPSSQRHYLMTNERWGGDHVIGD